MKNFPGRKPPDPLLACFACTLLQPPPQYKFSFRRAWIQPRAHLGIQRSTKVKFKMLRMLFSPARLHCLKVGASKSNEFWTIEKIFSRIEMVKILQNNLPSISSKNILNPSQTICNGCSNKFYNKLYFSGFIGNFTDPMLTVIFVTGTLHDLDLLSPKRSSMTQIYKSKLSQLIYSNHFA